MEIIKLKAVCAHYIDDAFDLLRTLFFDWKNESFVEDAHGRLGQQNCTKNISNVCLAQLRDGTTLKRLRISGASSARLESFLVHLPRLPPLEEFHCPFLQCPSLPPLFHPKFPNIIVNEDASADYTTTTTKNNCNLIRGNLGQNRSMFGWPECKEALARRNVQIYLLRNRFSKLTACLPESAASLSLFMRCLVDDEVSKMYLGLKEILPL